MLHMPRFGTASRRIRSLSAMGVILWPGGTKLAIETIVGAESSGDCESLCPAASGVAAHAFKDNSATIHMQS